MTPEFIGFDIHGDIDYKIMLGIFDSEVVYQIIFIKKDKFECFKLYLKDMAKDIDTKLLPVLSDWFVKGGF